MLFLVIIFVLFLSPVTVFEDEDKIFSAICAGAAGYLLKTASLTEIIGAIRQVKDGGAPINPQIASRILGFFKQSSASCSCRIVGLSNRRNDTSLTQPANRAQTINESLLLTCISSFSQNVLAQSRPAERAH